MVERLTMSESCVGSGFMTGVKVRREAWEVRCQHEGLDQGRSCGKLCIIFPEHMSISYLALVLILTKKEKG